MYQNKNFRYSRKASGRVIELKNIGNQDDPDSFKCFPVYSFMVNGEEIISTLPIEIKHQPILNKPEWIYYNADNPQEFMPEDLLNKEKQLPQLMFYISVIIAILSVFFTFAISFFRLG